MKNSATMAMFFVLIALAGCDRGTKAEPTAPSPKVATGPNIFLITLESLRPDHVGCYTGKRPTTPTLDALAAEGITFDHCYSTTSWTLASHAALFTGLYPTAANVVLPKDRLDASYKTIAELLSDIGYDAAAVVSGDYLSRKFKLDQGFGLYDDSPITTDGSHIDDITNPQMEAGLTGFLDRRGRQDKPFFLFAYFWDPHYDYIPPSPYNSMFVPPDAKPIDLTFYDQKRNPVKRGISPQELAYVISQYDGEIRCTDDTLGRVFQKIKDLGLWDNTVIIVTSDHGEEFFDHGDKGHKNNLYVESVHVPLIIKPAGGSAPRRDARLTSLVDIYPTIAKIAGVSGKLPPHHGRSLLGPDPGRPVFGELTTTWFFTDPKTQQKWLDSDRWLSIREGPQRTVGMEPKSWRPGTTAKPSRWETYNLAADPAERQPLAGSAGDEALTRHKSMLQDWDGKLEKTAALLGKRGEADLSPAEIERLKAIGYLNE